MTRTANENFGLIKHKQPVLIHQIQRFNHHNRKVSDTNLHATYCLSKQFTSGPLVAITNAARHTDAVFHVIKTRKGN